MAENSRARPFVALKRFSEGMGSLTASRMSYPLWFISLHLSFSRRFGGSWRSTGNTKEYKENLIRNKNERDSEQRKMTGKKCGADGEAPGLSVFSLMMKDCSSWH